MKPRSPAAVGYLVLATASLVWSSGCGTRMVFPRVDVDVSRLPPDIYVETAQETAAEPVAATEEEAIRRALERDPDLLALREAARVAWAQARTVSGLRDPEFGVAFGRGDRITERTWLVPRAELMPTLVYPSRGTLVTSHPEDLGLSTDPRVPRVLIPAGGEEAYLERSPRTFRDTTSDSDMFRTSIRFYPPNPFTMMARGAANRAGYAAAVCDLYALEWQIRCRVRWLLARLRYLERDIAYQDEVVALRKKIADATEELSRQGQVLALDAVGVSQQYLKAAAEREQAVAERTMLQRELERLVGGPMKIPARYIEAPTNSNVEVFLQKDWRRLVIERRRDIGAAYWRAQAAESMLREARLTRIPWFTQIEGSMSRAQRKDRPETAWELQRGTAELDPLYNIALDETEESEWRVEAMITIPLFSAGPGATRVQAAERRRAWAQLGSTTRRALDDVRDRIKAWHEAEKRRQETQQLLQPYRDQARAALEAFKSGRGLPGYDQDRLELAVLDMLRLAAKREFELVEAQWRVEEALGIPLEEAAASLTIGSPNAGATDVMFRSERPDIRMSDVSATPMSKDAVGRKSRSKGSRQTHRDRSETRAPKGR